MYVDSTFSLRNLGMLLALGLWAGIAGAAPISKVPITISKPGNYTLTKNLKYNGTGNAITVAADNVTIDLRGFTVEGNPAQAADNITAGVFSNFQRNVTVRNGTIRGFFRGVFLEGDNNSGGHMLELLRVEGCRFLGIQAKGEYTTVRDNQVVNTGGTSSLSTERFGIHLIGSNLRVLNNDVQEITPVNGSSTVSGIYLESSPASIVERNRVTQKTNSSFNAAGITIKSSGYCIIRSNSCIAFYYGLYLQESQSAEYTDNVTSACNVTYSGTAIDSGNNR